jgi:hypothetical protein
MTPRERMLVIVVLALLLFGGGGAAAYMLILSPLQDKKQAAEKLQKEVDDLDAKVRGMQKAAPQVAAVKRASLPPDLPPDPRDPNRMATYSFAVAEYKRLMQHLLLRAGITDGRPTSDKVLVNGRTPVTPEIAPKKPAYATITVNIEINKANLWQIIDFLYGYYQLDLLHQITKLHITREGKPTEGRGGLKVSIESEAIALEGVPPRANLITAPTPVAAVAGIPGLQAVSAKPSMVEKLIHSGALASIGRDYTYIVRNDVFYGPMPPFVLGKIDNVVMKRDERARDVKLKLSGDGVKGAKIVATATGSLLPDGPLEVDPDSQTITIPAVETNVANSATAKIEVTTTSSLGKVQKGSFTVSVERMPRIDIAAAIKLVIVSTASDGTAEAFIKDNANPLRYVISVKDRKIEVMKWWQPSGKSWNKDRDYDQPPAVLMISDEETSTKRTFKVLAIERDALIVCDIGKPESSKSDSKASPFPSKGPRPSGVPYKQGSADPVNAVASAITAGVPQPIYYRWMSGKSLKELVDPSSKNPCRIKPEEAREILRRVSTEGPVLHQMLLSSGN